jgi:hypothetical protein
MMFFEEKKNQRVKHIGENHILVVCKISLDLKKLTDQHICE